MKILTFGCRLNSFESALIKQAAGEDLEDVILVNTCAVTAEAERQCRQAIRQAHRAHPQMRIVVAGCAAQLHPERFAAMPEVARVLGNHEKLTREALLSEAAVLVGDPAAPADVPLLTDFEGRTRALLQIQQGCDHACTFCIVPQARGKNRGLPAQQVLKQARIFVDNGFSELVLTGVDITSYPFGFDALVERLATEVKGLKRLRFGSLDPAGISERFVRLFGELPVIMPHLHFSMQAGDDLILKRMGRRHTAERALRLIETLKNRREDVAVGADIIAGFPTETEEQFARSLAFIREAGVTHVHAFPFSPRPGTPAAKMPLPPQAVRAQRARLLRAAGEQVRAAFMEKMIGKTLNVLIERDGMGYSENYLSVQTQESQAGKIVAVKIKQRENDVLGV